MKKRATKFVVFMLKESESATVKLEIQTNEYEPTSSLILH